MNDSSKVLIGLLAGLAAGTALGLLFAPEAGTETRERLGQSFRDLSDTIKEKAAGEIEHLTSLKDKVVDTVKGKINPEDEFADELDIA